MKFFASIILLAIVIVGALIWEGTLTVPSNEDISHAIDVVAAKASVSGTVEQIRETFDPEIVSKEIKTWALRDGIQLPKGWVVTEKNIDADTRITVLIPAVQKNDNDYITYDVLADIAKKLPPLRRCAHENKDGEIMCVVGDNSETNRVFDLLEYVRSE